MAKKRWSAKSLGLSSKASGRTVKNGVVAERRTMRLSDLNVHPQLLAVPSPAGLTEALGRVMSNEVRTEWRRVPVTALVVRKECVIPEGLDLMVRNPPPAEGPIPVVALSDGRLLAFDDATAVMAWQMVEPEAEVNVYVVPFAWPEDEFPIK